MFSTLRTRFGIPGVISVIALVFAMFGGAYAASNSSGGGKATASAKAKKGPRGPKGAKGDTGPAGPQGPAGSVGAKGDPGAAGVNGTAGTPGSPGQSVTSVVEPPTPLHCENGGFKLTSASGTQYVCNGENGQNGQSGFTSVLPSGKTETGAWSFSASHSPASTSGTDFVPVSFAIPLENELDETHVHVAPDPACTGSAANPTAPAGSLCVYTGLFEAGTYPLSIHKAASEGLEAGASRSGAVLLIEYEGGTSAAGTWAVTAP